MKYPCPESGRTLNARQSSTFYYVLPNSLIQMNSTFSFCFFNSKCVYTCEGGQVSENKTHKMYDGMRNMDGTPIAVAAATHIASVSLCSVEI